ncbi:MAG: phosphatase [Marinilabiliales bacterium]|nr:MAG: phosphatase [Marinilabiliales bacterium]
MDAFAKFQSIGAETLISFDDFEKRNNELKAYVFDWDGVFNSGVKSTDGGSSFSEPDSMGINMLRFSYFLKHGKLPFTAIITGEINETAQKFARREHFDALWMHVKNKGVALKDLAAQNTFIPAEATFTFDDILDLGAADISGLRFYVRRKAAPMLEDYISENHLADYITACDGNSYAVREVCEFLIALNGNYTETINNRKAFSEKYAEYLKRRNEVNTQFETLK